VHDSLSVEIGNSLQQLPHCPCRLQLLAPESIDERAITGVLHHEEDVVLVVEVPVELHHVGMGKGVVDAQLRCQLRFHPVLFNCRLEDLLYGAEETSCTVHAEVDVTELARTDAFTKVEIAYCERMVGRGGELLRGSSKVVEKIRRCYI
jgi:hypothetical protein